MYKYILLITITIKYYNYLNFENNYLLKLCETSYEICPFCFQNEINCCVEFFHMINFEEIPTDIIKTIVHRIIGKRNLVYAKLKDITEEENIIIKYYSNLNELEQLLNKQQCTVMFLHNENNNSKCLQNLQDYIEISLVQNSYDLDLIHICKIKSLSKLLAVLQHKNKENHQNNKLYSLIDLFLNSEKNLFIFLNIINKTYVPKVKNSCGLFHIQKNMGIPLFNYLNKSFYIRLMLALQLIDVALDLTNNINGFRFYLTDLTYDNIVVDPDSLQISIIDFDYIIVHDTDEIILQKNHKYDIHLNDDCENCINFIPDDLCNHYSSDINIFGISQLLKKDLYGNIDNGLLHSIPTTIETKYPNIMKLLDTCIKCDDVNCNRFICINELYNLLLSILNDKSD